MAGDAPASEVTPLQIPTLTDTAPAAETPHAAPTAFAQGEEETEPARELPQFDLNAPATPQPQQHTTQPHRSEFPRSAVDALGSLDMPLPPRATPTPTSSESATQASPAATQPVVSPETTERQAFAAPSEAPHASKEIEAGTAGSAAVAGLGAMPFGALKLDFDLELPPGPAQTLPAFTPEDLAKIARNKLELAAEYIELGDLSGARALIHEVIESNDAATRGEARALLSTLAPLS